VVAVLMGLVAWLLVVVLVLAMCRMAAAGDAVAPDYAEDVL
jgi:hypothetical protein